jgi:hypothetical protein
VFGDLGAKGAPNMALFTALLTELCIMNGQLAGVEDWRNRLKVVLDVQGHQRADDKVKQLLGCLASKPFFKPCPNPVRIS